MAPSPGLEGHRAPIRAESETTHTMKSELDDFESILASLEEDQEPEPKQSKTRDPNNTVGRRTGLAAAAVGIATKKRTFLDASYRTVTPAEMVPSLPEASESRHILIDDSFTLGTLIPHIQTLIAKPVELTMATLGLNDETADSLAKLMHQGKITRLRLAMSAYFYGADKGIAQAIIGLLRPLGAQFAVERNHAKLQLYKPATGAGRYVLETSSNLRSCNCLEICAITNDAALYDFHDKWLTTFFNKNEVTE